MSPKEVIFLSLAVLTIVIICYMMYRSYYKTHDSFHEMTDKEIFEFISKQPDGLVSIALLANNSVLSKSFARTRLSSLAMQGLLATNHTKNFKAFYSLKEKIKGEPYPTLSSHPFLSLGDLMILFKHFDYKLSVQNICMVTNLPVAVIMKEMKYFEQKKVVVGISQTIGQDDGMGSAPTRSFYILNEPYRNNPDAYFEEEEVFNLDLEKMYEEVVKKGKA